MAYGLSDSEMAEMVRVFATNEKVKEVILYGSRGKARTRRSRMWT